MACDMACVRNTAGNQGNSPAFVGHDSPLRYAARRQFIGEISQRFNVSLTLRSAVLTSMVMACLLRRVKGCSSNTADSGKPRLPPPGPRDIM